MLVQRLDFLLLFVLFPLNSQDINFYGFLEPWQESLLEKVVWQRPFSPLDVRTHC